MKLIDADAINFEDMCDCCPSADCGDCPGPEGFASWLKKQPTAYDPDKIVEQLDEKAFEMWDEDNPYTNPKVIKLDRAIEILKGECNGQIDNDTDKAIEQLEEKFLTEKDFRAKGCWLDAIEIVKSGGAENDS